MTAHAALNAGRTDEGQRASGSGSPLLLLTVEEAAERLGIGRTTMFGLIRSGDVESVQIGRLRRIRPAALEAYTRRLASAPGGRTEVA
ncbi:MAG: helix-turn-helix domain-containing protein [Kineosporiaceae bacterium]